MKPDRLEDTIALEHLASEYWHIVDVLGGAGIGDLWTEDATFILDGRKLEGRPAIVDFYDWRKSRGPRVSIHVVTNVRPSFSGLDSADVTTALIAFAADGEPPISGTLPMVVGTTADVCRRDSDGHWRYASRNVVALFKSLQEPTLPPLHRSGKS